MAYEVFQMIGLYFIELSNKLHYVPLLGTNSD